MAQGAAAKTCLDKLKFDSAIADDNMAGMAKLDGGSTMVFYLTPMEIAGKGVALGVFRMLTFNTVQRCSTIVLYNVNNDNTRRELENARAMHNDYMSLNKIKTVLENCGESVYQARKEDRLRYNGDKFVEEVGAGYVGLKIWLDT